MFADLRDPYTILASGMPGKPGGDQADPPPGGDADADEGEEEDDEE